MNNTNTRDRIVTVGPVGQWLILLGCIFVLAASATADVVKMTDGRHFEGTILAQTKSVVKIDTVVATIRVTLTLKRPEIATVSRSPVPKGFFDPPPVADRISDRHALNQDDNLYLEVPIVGVFGQTVFSEGLRDILAYATKYKIRHIVFSIDSSGGNLDEAQATFELLDKYDEALTYHALLRHCVGDALAIPLWCDTLHVFPGATVGGSNEKWSDRSDKIDPDQEAILRAQVANEVAMKTREHRRHERGSQLVRAMIDPAPTIAVWRNERNELVTGTSPPSDLPPGKLVVADGPDSVLVLSYDQAVELGVESFSGDVQQLGEQLGLANWKPESDFGTQAMAKAAATKQKDAQEAKAKYAARVKQNIQRRNTTERYIDHNLQEAAAWDPSKGSYATYASRWRWGSSSTTRLTRESRQKWRDRTQASMHYLRRAAKGLVAIKKLDEEAASLGLSRTYQTGQLQWMIQDIEAKYQYLHMHQGKKNK